MNSRLFLKGLEASAFEQDVRVTEINERDVRLQQGDEVDVLVRAQVQTVIAHPDAPWEVALTGATPVKVLAVRRAKRG